MLEAQDALSCGSLRYVVSLIAFEKEHGAQMRQKSTIRVSATNRRRRPATRYPDAGPRDLRHGSSSLLSCLLTEWLSTHSSTPGKHSLCIFSGPTLHYTFQPLESTCSARIA